MWPKTCDKRGEYHKSFEECPLCVAERAAHLALHNAFANADGTDAARVEARLLAQRYGLDGDDSANVNAKLGND